MASDSKAETKRETEAQDEDSGLSMVDVLEEEKLLEEDAKAVLGDSDDKNCTYLMGYVPRQALYSCITCVSPPELSAGVCLACSYECHEGHELVELYTKRNFRCDCGNSKFNDMKCKLCPTKLERNSENKYDQNFSGRYCTCHRPYPDFEDTEEDEMIQCVVCEDWYHGRHLTGKIPDDYEEMICQGCMKKNYFLWAYSLSNNATDAKNSSKNSNVDADAKNSGKNTNVGAESKNSGKNTSTDAETKNSGKKTNVDVETKNSGKNTNVDVENISKDDKKVSSPCKASSTKSKEDKAASSGSSATTSTTRDIGPEGGTCCLPELQRRKKGSHDGATFWPQGWRTRLCRCNACKTRYSAGSVVFLIDLDDTVHAYEERGKQKHGTCSNYDQGMQALSSMNRVQQVEVIHGYNNLKDELKVYLKKFADNGKMVREEDIREFFSEMQARKKQRVDAAGASSMQWGCR